MRVPGVRTFLPFAVLVVGLALLAPMLLEKSNSTQLSPGTAPVKRSAPVRREPLVATPPPPVKVSPARFAGRVTGEPLPLGAGAWIQLTGADEPYRADLDADGRFEFRQVPAGVPLDVWLGPDPGGSHVCRLATGLVLKPEERREVAYVARTKATLSGRVVDEKGDPVPAVRVALLPPDRDWRTSVPIAASTDAGGRFFVGLAGSGVPPALRLVVDAVNRGYILEERVVSGADLAGGRALTIRLTKGLVIAGRAVGPDGRPLADATVHLIEDYRGDPELRRPVEGRVTTDAKGRFRDDAYRPGVYTIYLQGDMGGRRYRSVTPGVAAGTEDVTLHFEGFGEIRARFEDDATRAPLDVSEVTAEFVWGYDGDTERYVGCADGRGVSVDFPGLPAGHYRLRVAAPGYRPLLSDLLYVEPGGCLGPVVFRLKPR